jgi:hypothetical protein
VFLEQKIFKSADAIGRASDFFFFLWGWGEYREILVPRIETLASLKTCQLEVVSVRKFAGSNRHKKIILVWMAIKNRE